MKIPFVDFTSIHLSLRDELYAAFDRVLNKNWFILGAELEGFEKSYAAYNKVKYAIGVSNGLDALHLSLLSLGIGQGDEIVVPSNTYIATVLAISYIGATPVFVEPDIRSYNIDPRGIEEKITNKTKAIMPVHLYGQACNMEEIMNIANRSGLYVIEDNAQSHGAEWNNKMAGSWGHINGTSFYPGKNLGALGDAGMVTTDDQVLAEKIQTLRNYGSSLKYYNEVIGYNRRMDEIQASFLSVKLSYLYRWTKERQDIASWYLKSLEGIGDLILPQTLEKASHVYHIFLIRTKHRDPLRDHLKKNGVDTLIHYPVPPHLQKAYVQLGYKKGAFPISEEIAETCLSLPIWPGMKQNQVEYIKSVLIGYFKNA